MSGMQQKRSRSQSFGGPSIKEDDYLAAIFGNKTASAPGSYTTDDIFKATEQTPGIDFEKHQNIPVKCTGDFKPISAFDDCTCSLPKEVINNIRLAKYQNPTPIQKYAIPVGLAGRDLMACAQTGSGKTAAFLVPVISRMLKETEKKKTSAQRTGQPTYLVLAPTRELAMQIHKEALKFAHGTWIRPVVVYGGASIGSQLKQVEKGVDILVATPGRLLDLLERERLSLQRVKFLCFDEADRMLDMGFEPDVRRIVSQNGMPPTSERVTTMFSATFPPEIQRLASEFMNSNYIHLTVGKIGSTNESITQVIKFVEVANKRAEVLKDLKLSPGRTLVFCEKKRDTENLSRYIFSQGIPASSIHGDRDQREREAALAAFKSGRIMVLVATDVASRGLDIPEVAHVINYDLPISIDSYVHRIGRTGRAGNRGTATSYFDENDGGGMAKDLARLLRESKQAVPDWLMEVKGGGKGKDRRHTRRDTPFGGGGGGRSRGGGQRQR